MDFTLKQKILNSNLSFNIYNLGHIKRLSNFG